MHSSGTVPYECSCAVSRATVGSKNSGLPLSRTQTLSSAQFRVVACRAVCISLQHIPTVRYIRECNQGNLTDLVWRQLRTGIISAQSLLTSSSGPCKPKNINQLFYVYGTFSALHTCSPSVLVAQVLNLSWLEIKAVETPPHLLWFASVFSTFWIMLTTDSLRSLKSDIFQSNTVVVQFP